MSDLCFDGVGCAAFCPRIEKYTFQRLKIKDSSRFSQTQKKFFHAYHYRHFKTVRGRLEEFPSGHGSALTCLVECDDDCRDFAADVGLGSSIPRHAHKIADAVAWSNNKGSL